MTTTETDELLTQTKKLERRIKAESRRSKALEDALSQILTNCCVLPQKEIANFEQFQNWNEFLESARELIKKP
jgi:hypothetical protein